MSRLGIAFVLPYTGANGIVVNNNQIGLDPNGVGKLGALSLNENGFQNNNGNSGGEGGSILLVCSSRSEGSGPNIECFDNDTNLDIAIINIDGDINNGNSPYNSASLQTNTIQTVRDNPNSPIMSFDYQDSNNNIAFTINEVSGDSLATTPTP